MKLRTLAATAAVAAVGGLAVTLPATAADPGTPVSSVVYDTVRFPGSATVTTTTGPTGRSFVTLSVTGGLPNRTYGAHAHVNGCTTVPADAGGHWQRVSGPMGDARYANPGNELWLDVTTDAHGNGTATATQDFSFSPAGRPKSVIIHADPTGTGTAAAGIAGARLACTSVAF